MELVVVTESGGATIFDDFGAMVDRVGQGKSKETKPSKGAATPEGMTGRREPPAKGWRWVRRNWWRLSVGAAALVVLVVVAVGFVFPTGDLARGAGTWVASWRGGGHPLGPSRFDNCWAGGPSRVCGPSAEETVSAVELVLIGLASVVVWWRVAELAAVGEGPVGRWTRRRRQARLLRAIRDQWRYAVIELKWLSPPTKWQARWAKVGLHPKGPFPQCEIRNLRLDMIGGVVADLHYRRLADVARFERPTNLGRLATALAFEAGHRRRLRAPRWVKRRTWPAWTRCLRVLRPLAWPAAAVAGEKRYVLRPREIQVGTAEVGHGDRVVRLAYPATDADLLVPDTAPAPDQSRVRVALGRDVIYWDRNKHPHLGVFGPTSKGKGHILRRLVWQCLQVGQLVVMIDGQGGSEHGLFRGFKNYWWFDAPKYKREHGAAGLAPWVTSSLSPEEAALLAKIPAALLHQVAHLVYVRNQLRALVAIGWERNEVADRNLGQGWHEWPEGEQRANPRVTVCIDEGNTLLSKGSGPGQLGEGLRQEIGALIGVLLFGGRKYGLHVAFGAQILYAASWMARGMYAQLGFISASGSMPTVHQLMVSQVKDWPSYPDEVGYGVCAAYANEASIEAVRYPPAFPKVYAPLIQAALEAIAVQDAERVASS